MVNPLISMVDPPFHFLSLSVLLVYLIRLVPPLVGAED